MATDLLTIERYAEVLAHQRHFGDEAASEMRERLGVEKAWEASQTHWLAAIEADTERDEPELVTPFAKSFGETGSRLDEEQPALESLGPLAEAPALEEEPEPEAAPAPAPPAPPAPAPAPPTPEQPAPVEVASSGSKAVELPGAAAARAAALPPAVRLPGALEPSPWAGASQEPSPSVDETAFVSVLVAEDPLPFVAGPAFAGRQDSPRPLAELQLPDVAGMTAEVPTILADDNQTLPFVVLPSKAIDAEILGKLTIERYASLSAEIARRPDRIGDTLRRYGVDDHTHQLLQEAWGRHFEANEADRCRFDELVHSFRSWLEQNR